MTLQTFPKARIVRSEAYRRFVASHPCFSCGISGMSQCAHANEGKGMGMKVCDTRSFPLCPTCHTDLDQSRNLTREERRALEAKWVARMQRMAETSWSHCTPSSWPLWAADQKEPHA